MLDAFQNKKQKRQAASATLKTFNREAFYNTLKNVEPANQHAELLDAEKTLTEENITTLVEGEVRFAQLVGVLYKTHSIQAKSIEGDLFDDKIVSKGFDIFINESYSFSAYQDSLETRVIEKVAPRFKELPKDIIALLTKTAKVADARYGGKLLTEMSDVEIPKISTNQNAPAAMSALVEKIQKTNSLASAVALILKDHTGNSITAPLNEALRATNCPSEIINKSGLLKALPSITSPEATKPLIAAAVALATNGDEAKATQLMNAFEGKRLPTDYQIENNPRKIQTKVAPENTTTTSKPEEKKVPAGWG